MRQRRLAITHNTPHLGVLLCLLVILVTSAAAVGHPLQAGPAPARAGAETAVDVANVVVEDRPTATVGTRKDSDACGSERQVVHCSHAPTPEQRKQCCVLYGSLPASPRNQRVAAEPAALDQAEAIALTKSSTRPDLQPHVQPNFTHLRPACFAQVQLPVLPEGSNQPVGRSTQLVPRLTSSTIRRVKAHALDQLPRSTRDTIRKLQWVHPLSRFLHPASIAGPAELVLMQQRLQAQQQPQHAAKRALLSGGGVRPKYYIVPDTGRQWAPPVDCPPEGYKGPYAIPEVNIDWGGIDAKPLSKRVCSEWFDPEAPQNLCGHLSFVELDAVMAYKQAVAWWATDDDRHLRAAVSIIAAWSSNSSRWGVKTRNGPLEAAWGVASMARGLELLRHEVPPKVIKDFLHWVNGRLMPQMDWFVEEGDLGALHSNFHAAIADAMTAVAVLSDSRARWNKARTLFDKTVQRYLRWGKDIWSVDHVLGECTETQRDVFHSQFGLAGLLQAAEMAFQQDEDWYSSNDHALAAAVELHARIVRAATEEDERLLPQGFKFFESMPEPPAGTYWRYDLQYQNWAAHNSTTNARVFDRVADGYKYMVGAHYLPAGYELAYNHFSNRLGLRMPETAALLQRMWPEWYELFFGLATITHANTAAELWVPGIKAGFKQC